MQTTDVPFNLSLLRNPQFMECKQSPMDLPFIFQSSPSNFNHYCTNTNAARLVFLLSFRSRCVEPCRQARRMRQRCGGGRRRSLRPTGWEMKTFMKKTSTQRGLASPNTVYMSINLDVCSENNKKKNRNVTPAVIHHLSKSPCALLSTNSHRDKSFLCESM